MEICFSIGKYGGGVDMVTVLVGDVLKSKAQTLVNTVNCVGVMGKGIALLFKQKYPDMYRDYTRRCMNLQVKPGVPYHYTDIFGNSIVNFPTKNHWRSPSRIQDIVKGLDIFVNKYREWGVTSVAFPPLGCGNGGQEWRVIGRIMYQKLSRIDIPVEIYAPFGTPHDELKENFLSQKVLLEDYNQVNQTKSELTPEKIVILEVLNRLGQQAHAVRVGRTMFQKICYIITETGVNTQFTFKKGYYGPFSPEDVKRTIHLFANSNLIAEKQLGRMVVISIGPEYPKVRKKYERQLVELEPKIEKTVDLFSRIKNTEQAEEVATVYYIYRELAYLKPGQSVTEQEIFDSVLSWKRKWNDPMKRERLASAIRNLAMLKWISVSYSDSLPVDELV
jgi:O-acetyl-ADP-ribose deacetylase (regulator of RNase III)